jgi:hypothetical protein
MIYPILFSHYVPRWGEGRSPCRWGKGQEGARRGLSGQGEGDTHGQTLCVYVW